MQDEKGGIIRQQRRKSPLSLADLSHCHHKHSVFPQALNSLIFPINFLCFTFNMRTRIYHMHLYNLYLGIGNEGAVVGRAEVTNIIFISRLRLFHYI